MVTFALRTHRLATIHTLETTTTDDRQMDPTLLRKRESLVRSAKNVTRMQFSSLRKSRQVVIENNSENVANKTMSK